jgi:hypothetical protein
VTPFQKSALTIAIDWLTTEPTDLCAWAEQGRRVRVMLEAALAEPEHIHSCGPDCQKPMCVNRRREIAAAVEAEREACARVCENGLPIASSMTALDDMEMWGEKFAAAIRARGSK